MGKTFRWFGRIAIALVIAAFSSFATTFYLTFRPHPKVPLTSNLAAGQKGTWDEVSADFDSRLKSQFPVGSPEGAMATELRKQGFARDDWTSSVGAEHEAVRREDNWVCNQAAHVYWQADALGTLKTIRGLYREEGCL